MSREIDQNRDESPSNCENRLKVSRGKVKSSNDIDKLRLFQTLLKSIFTYVYQSFLGINPNRWAIAAGYSTIVLSDLELYFTPRPIPSRPKNLIKVYFNIFSIFLFALRSQHILFCACVGGYLTRISEYLVHMSCVSELRF
jgi:hypothetical protein